MICTERAGGGDAGADVRLGALLLGRRNGLCVTRYAGRFDARATTRQPSESCSVYMVAALRNGYLLYLLYTYTPPFVAQKLTVATIQIITVEKAPGIVLTCIVKSEA